MEPCQQCNQRLCDGVHLCSFSTPIPLSLGPQGVYKHNINLDLSRQLLLLEYWLATSYYCDYSTMRESQYRWVLYLQYLLIFVDLFVNSFADLLRLDNVTQLVLFIIQDICLIFATIVVFLMFFNTYVFQAGLVGYLVNKFKFTIAILFLYFILCLGLHIWTMTLRWEDVDAYIWNEGYQALYVFQRVGAVFYYYYYKRTALRLGDPRFYRDSAWLRRQFGKVR